MRTEASIRGRHPSEAKLMAIREYHGQVETQQHLHLHKLYPDPSKDTYKFFARYCGNQL